MLHVTYMEIKLKVTTISYNVNMKAISWLFIEIQPCFDWCTEIDLKMACDISTLHHRVMMGHDTSLSSSIYILSF